MTPSGVTGRELRLLDSDRNNFFEYFTFEIGSIGEGIVEVDLGNQIGD